jgi:hypothetical protein
MHLLIEWQIRPSHPQSVLILADVSKEHHTVSLHYPIVRHIRSGHPQQSLILADVGK